MRTVDVDVRFAVVIGPVLQRIVRLLAVTLAVGAFLMAGLGMALEVADGVPAASRWAGAALTLILSLPMVQLPLDDPSTAIRNQRIVEGYPLLLAVVGATFQVVFEPTVVLGLFLLLTVVMGALFVRRWILAVLLTIAVGAQIGGTLAATDPDWFTTSGYVIVTLLITAVVRAAGLGYRAAVRSQVEAQLLGEHRAERLRTIATAARDLHVLDPEALVASVADAAGRLGWSEVGLWSPRSVRDDDALPGAGDPAPPHELVDEVGARGRTIATGADTDGATWSDGVRRTTVGAPVIVDGALRAALVVGRVDGRLEDDEALLVELLADQAARALEVTEDHRRRGQGDMGRLDPADFLATVSHELRTPLHVVLGFAETVHERWTSLDDDDRRHMVGRLRDNARGLHHVIESMLDYSRLEAGAVQAHRRIFDIVPIVRDVVDRLEGLADDHTLTVDAAESAEVWGDPLLLERAVENLVSNALRHTPSGTSVQVRVDAGESRTRVVVQDDGPGMSAEDAARLGTRFFRGRSTAGTRGVGLGLVFTVEVLRQHGAELQLATAPGAGAQFAFALARAPARTRA